jgi:RNA polymerase sigma factor (sigma-70 family)
VSEDSSLFEAAIVQLMPDLLAYFVRRVQPREDSADCLSETIVVLWRQRGRLPPTLPDRRAWAFGVARRVLANQRRGRMRRIALADRLRASLEVFLPPTSSLESLALSASLDLLSVLPPPDAELVRLVVWDGFGVAEAGALLGLRAGAARMRYSRAKDVLRGALGG